MNLRNKKAKRRSTIREALLAANLEEYISNSETPDPKPTNNKNKKNQPKSKIYFLNPNPTSLPFSISSPYSLSIVVYQTNYDNKRGSQQPKKRKSRWEYEVPALDLDHLYTRIGEIMEQHLYKKRQFRKRTKNQKNKKLMSTSLLDGFDQKNSGGVPRLSNLNNSNSIPVIGGQGFNSARGNTNGFGMEIESQGRSFGYHAQTTNQSSDNTIMGIVMPENLKDYVVRAYAKCKGNKNKERQMTGMLQTAIQDSKKLGDVYTRNWANHPLPLFPYEKMRQNQINFNSGYNNTGFNNQNVDFRGNPFLRNQYMNKTNQSNGKQFDATGVSFGLNQNVGNHKGFEFGKKKGRKFERANKKGNNKKSKIDQLISKQEQNNLRELIRRQGKNRNISDDRDDKYIDTNDYIDQVKRGLNFDDDNAAMILDSRLKIIGTSQKLEKKYFRLTEVPDPSTVRPLPVLKRSLKHILKRYENKEVDYRFVLDQFRSIRLDMGIQRVRDEFTVKVYEENALFCLEIGDADQFNKCQMKLYELYNEGIAGRKSEFLMYRVLYLILNSEKSVLARFLKEQSLKDLESKPLKEALKLKKSLVLGNIDYVFGQLETGFQGTKYLLKLFLDKLRIWGLIVISKSYGKSIKMEYVRVKLRFEGLHEMIEFLEKHECSLEKEKGLILLKQSRVKLIQNQLMREGFD